MKRRILLAASFVVALAVALPLFAGGRADFNGDGKSDVIWRHEVTGDVALWEMDGRSIIDGSVIFSVPDFNYQIQGYGDFNGDGYDDIFWRNSVTHELAIWEMQGRTILDGSPLALRVGPEWEVAGFGDFHGDGRDEILWWNEETNQVAMWEMNGHEIVDGGIFFTVSGEHWRIIDVGDFGGDGIDDILWFRKPDLLDLTNTVSVWHMNGRTIVSGRVVSSGGWDEMVVGAGDFDGDGFADILTRDRRDGTTFVWYGRNFDAPGRKIRQWPADYRWNIEQIGDFDGNGQDEILWWNSDTTDVSMWELCQMQAPTLGHCTDSDGGIIFRVWDPDWQIQPPGAKGTPRPEDALHWRVTTEAVSGAQAATGCVAGCSLPTTVCLQPLAPDIPVRLRVLVENTGAHMSTFSIEFAGGSTAPHPAPAVKLVSATPPPFSEPTSPAGCFGTRCFYSPFGEGQAIEFIVDVTPPAGGFTGHQIVSVVTRGNYKPASEPGGDACVLFDPHATPTAP